MKLIDDTTNGTDPKPAATLEGVLEALIDRAVAKAVQATQVKDPELLTPEELAAKLKVDTSWVYERNRSRGLPVHYIGRYPRFILSEVLQALDQKKN